MRTRTEWIGRLFPAGIPQLWCPPLTHYRRSGEMDGARIAAHLRFISPWVKGLLVPGSTGDGWELSEPEAEQLLKLVLELAPKLGVRLLIGALHPDSSEAARLISARAAMVHSRASASSAIEALVLSNVCGFAVCPPRGAEVTQEAMEAQLAQILELGLPAALYQLPQVTQNEMSPDLLGRLASRYSNFILFKDTSGTDRVAQSGRDLSGVFLVRGMEGEYARWLKGGGGPYDGFLLASANCFPSQLFEIQEHLRLGRVADAERLSQRVERVVSGAFDLVKGLPGGNIFANGGKALDHFMAHGPGAASIHPPRLHSGGHIPEEVIRGAGSLLSAEGLMPVRGYLAD